MRAKTAITKICVCKKRVVDVGIAVDMVVDALKNNIDKLVLVSSDTDLIPAIKAAKAGGSKVVYVGFSNKTTKAIVAEADETEIIRDQEVVDAYDALNPLAIPQGLRRDNS